jgi:hypothetical protein
MSAFGEQHSGFEHMRELLGNFHRHEHVLCLFILHVVIFDFASCVCVQTPFVCCQSSCPACKTCGSCGRGVRGLPPIINRENNTRKKTSTGSAVGDATRERVGSIADYRNVFQAS